MSACGFSRGSLNDTDYGRDSVNRLGDKIVHVHIKGERRTDDQTLPGTFSNETRNGTEWFQQALLAEGEVDHYPTLKALHEIGYTGYLTLESHAPYPDIGRCQKDKQEIERLLRLIETEEGE